MLKSSRFWLYALVIAIACTIGAFNFPITNRAVRLFCAGSLSFVLLSAIMLTLQKRLVGYLACAAFFAGIVFLVLPGKPPDRKLLSDSYPAFLEHYTGTLYVWGGESSLGIDCSGLIRRAMVNTLFWTGLKTANPACVRLSANLWWNDTSARDFGEGIGTIPVRGTPARIEPGALDDLQPGDLAVTESGMHILAYLGDDRWIDADPSFGRTRITSTTENPWFTSPMKIVRWQRLSEP